MKHQELATNSNQRQVGPSERSRGYREERDESVMLLGGEMSSLHQLHQMLVFVVISYDSAQT